MSVPATTLIQLREDSALNTSNINDGEWINNLRQSITLNDGDTIGMKTCFIDNTTTSTGIIEVPSDKAADGSRTGTMKCTFTIGYYVMDYLGSFPRDENDVPVANKIYVDASLSRQNTGKPFILMDGTINPGGATTPRLLNQFDLTCSIDSSFGTSGNIMACQIYITLATNLTTTYYMRLATDTKTNKARILQNIKTVGNQQFITINKALIDAVAETANTFVFPADGSFRVTRILTPVRAEGQTKDNKHTGFNDKIDVSNEDITDGVVDKSAHAFYNDVDIFIPAKQYEPGELTRVINNLLTQFTTPTQAEGTTDNSFLLNTLQVKAKLGGQPTFMNLDMTQQFSFIDDDGAGNPLSFLIGSNQFGLMFDSDAQKFNIQQIHIPRFNDDGTNIIKCFRNKANEDILMNKHSGIFILNIEPQAAQDLFIKPSHSKGTSNSMKFNQNLTTTLQQISANLDGSDITAYLPTFLTDGVNVTGDLTDLDSVVFKKLDKANTRHFDMAPSFSEVPFDDVVGQSHVIESADIADAAKIGELGEGYYLIEVDFGINNDFKGTDIVNSKISSVVSRYYNNSNYITGSADGSIFYTHKGAPIDLSNFRCRILTPDGNLATDLNGASTIFLEIQSKK